MEQVAAESDGWTVAIGFGSRPAQAAHNKETTPAQHRNTRIDPVCLAASGGWVPPLISAPPFLFFSSELSQNRGCYSPMMFCQWRDVHFGQFFGCVMDVVDVLKQHAALVRDI
jgi:hypothetical protein